MIGSNDLNHIKSNQIGPNDLKSDQIIPNHRFRSFSFLFYLFELIQFIVFEWDQIPAIYNVSNCIKSYQTTKTMKATPSHRVQSPTELSLSVRRPRGAKKNGGGIQWECVLRAVPVVPTVI